MCNDSRKICPSVIPILISFELSGFCSFLGKFLVHGTYTYGTGVVNRDYNEKTLEYSFKCYVNV